MNKKQVEGQIDKSTGKVKEVTGRAVGNDEMEREGKVEHAKGSVKKNYGDAKSNVKEATK